MKRLLAILGLIAIGGCGETSSGNVLGVHGISNMQLREFESKELAFQYLDTNGYPIVGGAVRLRIDGASNGAVVETVIARADPQGVARTSIKAAYEASFVVVAEADGAMPVQVQVTVAKANGGILQVTVYSRSAASATQAQVTLVNNIACTTFDPRMPPAAAVGIAQPSHTVAISTSGTPVQFSGLQPGQQYAVIAVATNNGTTVAKGCEENISITQQEVEQRIPRAANVYLEDFSVDISGNALLVQTNFNYPLNLVRVANLLKEMSDSPSDPFDFIVERSLAGSDWWTSLLVGVVQEELSGYVTSQRPSAQLTRAKIQQVYQALANVSDVKLYTSLEINDESTDNPGQLTATHKFEYFTANVGGVNNKYYLRDGINLYGETPKMTLSTEAKLKLENAQRLRFEEHTLSLPIAEAIIGTLLVDTFNEYKLEAIFTAMVDCTGIADAVADYYKTWRDNPTSVEISAIKTGMNSACQSIVAEMAVDLYNDIRQDITDSGHGNQVTLAGHATIGMAADGSTITQLTGGEWIGVGTFTASR